MQRRLYLRNPRSGFWACAIVRGRSAALALCAMSFAWAPQLPARAEPAPSAADIDQNKARARSLADRGAFLLEAGQTAEALKAFEQAEREYHAPTILLMIARCRARLGHLVEAHQTYQRITTEALSGSAPPAFLEAQETARAEGASLNRQIPTLYVIVTGAGAEQATVRLDGQRIVPRSGPIPRNPGRVSVVVQVPGRPPVERLVTLAVGRAETLTLDLGHPLVPTSPPPERVASPQGSLIPATVAFGIAGLGLGVGTVTGVMAKIQIDDIKSRCQPDGHCLLADQPQADRAQTLITLSTVGFVAGGIAAATGVTLLILRPGRAAKQEGKAWPVQVAFRPGAVHVGGWF